MINRVTLIGNLGQDPEVKRLENGTAVARFSLATNESFKKDDEWQTLTEWHSIVAWRHLAERCESGLTKGVMVYVEGKLTHRTWEDENGTKRRSTDVVAKLIRRLSKQEGQAAQRSEMPSAEDEPVNTGPDDDLPF